MLSADNTKGYQLMTQKVVSLSAVNILCYNTVCYQQLTCYHLIKCCVISL
jgi:hypothetical protein